MYAAWVDGGAVAAAAAANDKSSRFRRKELREEKRERMEKIEDLQKKPGHSYALKKKHKGRKEIIEPIISWATAEEGRKTYKRERAQKWEGEKERS